MYNKVRQYITDLYCDDYLVYKTIFAIPPSGPCVYIKAASIFDPLSGVQHILRDVINE